MKNSRFQYTYRKSASKQHRQVGDILRSSSFFKNYQIYQEYPVNRINPEYTSSREHFDWVVLELKLVIEVHGIQHTVGTDFSGKLTPEETEEQFQALQMRDKDKEKAAIKAGYTYIAIPYNIEITEQYIIEQYQKLYNTLPTSTSDKSARDWSSVYQVAKDRYITSGKYQRDKEKARELRKLWYSKVKELKKSGHGRTG